MASLNKNNHNDTLIIIMLDMREFHRIPLKQAEERTFRACENLRVWSYKNRSSPFPSPIRGWQVPSCNCVIGQENKTPVLSTIALSADPLGALTIILYIIKRSMKIRAETNKFTII